MVKELTFEDINNNKKEILLLFESIHNRAGVENLIDFLNKSSFFTDPASANYHGAFNGGLALHSLTVYKNLKAFKEAKMLDASDESIILIALAHDICKVGTYKVSTRNVKDEQGKWIQVPYYTYADNMHPYGHGEKSVDMLRDLGITFSEDEKLAIRWHMGAYEGEQCWNNIGKAQELYPLVTYLHFADILASRYTA